MDDLHLKLSKFCQPGNWSQALDNPEGPNPLKTKDVMLIGLEEGSTSP